MITQFLTHISGMLEHDPPWRLEARNRPENLSSRQIVFYNKSASITGYTPTYYIILRIIPSRNYSRLDGVKGNRRAADFCRHCNLILENAAISSIMQWIFTHSLEGSFVPQPTPLDKSKYHNKPCTEQKTEDSNRVPISCVHGYHIEFLIPNMDGIKNYLVRFKNGIETIVAPTKSAEQY